MNPKGKRYQERITFRPFEDLGRILLERGHVLSAGVQKGDDCPGDDEEIFQEAMSDVREIQDFRQMTVARRNPGSLEMRRTHDVAKTLEEITTGRRPISIEMTQEYVEWRNPAYRVRPDSCDEKYHVAVQDTLDLHGMTVDEAFDELRVFLKEAVEKRRSCVKIIHGRGLRSPRGPVLKHNVITWLTRKYRRNVVSVMTARRCDGGLGAVYVRLRTDKSL
ncbi:MAG: Smr/MutS family protein [Thermodesulfovibrionales bacterium]